MVTTKYSISAANRISGKSRTTILKHIKLGKLSCEIDDNGNKVIDRSELLRVYGDACDFSREEGDKSSGSPKRGQTQSDQSAGQQLNSVQQQLDTLTKERERERSQLQQQIDHLQDALKQAQETANKAMLLLENRSGVGGLEKAFQVLEARVANQEKSVAETREKTRSDTIAEMRSKPWWQLPFMK